MASSNGFHYSLLCLFFFSQPIFTGPRYFITVGKHGCKNATIPMDLSKYLRKCRYNASHRLFLRLSIHRDRELLIIRVCEMTDRQKRFFNKQNR